MSRSILVVDEHEPAVSATVAALVDAGYAATGAHSFREAAQILVEAPPALLIASVRLGAYNGLHLLVRGRAERPDLAAIMIGAPSAAVESEARRLGAAAYVTQPFEMDALLGCAADAIRAGA
jgi:DNA-binding NtrC family response regulator